MVGSGGFLGLVLDAVAFAQKELIFAFEVFVLFAGGRAFEKFLGPVVFAYVVALPGLEPLLSAASAEQRAGCGRDGYDGANVFHCKCLNVKNPCKIRN